MPPLVILDNTVLSNFALVGRSDLPLLLWPDNLCTTAATCQEYLTGVEMGILPPDWSPPGETNA